MFRPDSDAKGGLRAEKEEKRNIPGFLDVSKAYYTVCREGLWEKMRMYGVEEKFIRVCQCLY